MKFMKINKEKFSERTLISTDKTYSLLCCSVKWSQKSATLGKKYWTKEVTLHNQNLPYILLFDLFNCHFRVYESVLNCLNSLWSFQLSFEDKRIGVLCFLTIVIIWGWWKVRCKVKEVIMFYITNTWLIL